MPGPGQQANAIDTDIDHGEITFYAGIGSARVTAWADALEVSPEAVVRAAGVVPPLMDTAKQTGSKKRNRATAPHLRCMAWTKGDLPKVRAALSK